MSKNAVYVVMLTLLLISPLTFAFSIQLVEANETIYIRVDGSVDPPTTPIQRDGDIYTFTSDVNSGIVVERSHIVIDGKGYTLQGVGSEVGFNLYNADDVTIKNTNIQSFTVGIEIYRSDNNTILANNITDNRFGIQLLGSNNVLRNNSMSSNQYNFDARTSSVNDVDTSNTVNGRPICYWVNEQDRVVPIDSGFVALINCTRIIAQDLNLTNNANGILLYFTTQSTITKNDITSNLCGIGVYESSDNDIFGNNLTKSDSSSVGLYHSLNNNISGNSMRKSLDYGVYFEFSSNNTLVGNEITGNSMDGVFLSYSSNNRIYGNNIIENQWSGITIAEASGNTIAENNIEANNWIGIYLSGSSDNIIYHNDLVDNMYQVSTDNSPNNIWDDGYPSGGNYWSDYRERYPNATELNGSGIWDTPYVIDEYNQDNYSLMEPWGSSSVLGDINDDGVVDIFDVVLVAKAFSSKPGDANWDQACDLNNDEIVDIFDVVLIAKNFGKTT